MQRCSPVRKLWGTLLLLCMTGCGYTSGVRLPADAKTLGVVVFDNTSPFPEVEREVFACISTQASRMIDGRMVAPGRADVVIRGSLDDYQRLHGVQSAEGSLQESGVYIMMHAWLEDRESGEMIGEVLYFNQAVRYILGVREEEAGARREALANLCQEIVLDLFSQPDEILTPSSPPEIEELEEHR